MNGAAFTIPKGRNSRVRACRQVPDVKRPQWYPSSSRSVGFGSVVKYRE